MWTRAYKKVFGDNPPKEPFTFHDLKAKGASDFEGASSYLQGIKPGG